MIPKVSVIMAAHNAERTIAAAVRSILWQTLSDIELIVVDDCSTDGTYDVLRVLAEADSRLRILRNAEHRERSWSRNRAIQAARAELIAVLDADDIALPQRLEIQTHVMEATPEVALVGGWGYEVDGRTGVFTSLSTAAVDHEEILARMRWSNPFVHSSVIFRREAALEAGLYDPAMSAAEDSDLFWRMLRSGAARIVPHPMVLARLDWEKARQVSRLRRMADVRTRWRGMRRRGEAALGALLFLLPGVLRLALPSAIDVRVRRGKRLLRRSPSESAAREWIRACETGEKPFSALFDNSGAGPAMPDRKQPGQIVL